MSYQVLARKWRPSCFADFVGQTHVVTALSNALDKQRLHHAYLLTGTRGVGKTTLARILAKSLNCEQGIQATACGTCGSCVAINEGRFADLIEVDAASRTKVEDTRELLENIQYAPTQGRYKVYLIDEVHMLSGHSFNALLKTLEEPPEHVKFILATTDPQKLPVTVLSRCLQFHLKHLSIEQIQQQLAHVLQQEQIKFETTALPLLAQAAEGSMRDALSLLDQAIAYGNESIKETAVRQMLGCIEQQYIYEICQALIQQRADLLLNQVNQLAEKTNDYGQVLAELINFLHRLAIVKAVPELAQQYTEQTEQLQHFAPQISAENLQLYYQIALVGRRDLPLAPQPRAGFEMVLLRMLNFGVNQTTVNEETMLVAEKSAKPAVAMPSPRNSKPVATNTTPTEAKPVVTDTNETQINTIKPASIEETQATSHEVLDTNTTVTTPVMPSTNATETSTLNWHAILPKLALSGFTQALASHCNIKSFEQNSLCLCLAPNHTPLLNDKQQQRLKEALETYFGHTIKLSVAIEEPSLETPAAQQAREQRARLNAAETALENDTNVKQMVNDFDAKIIKKSIQPLD